MSVVFTGSPAEQTLHWWLLLQEPKKWTWISTRIREFSFTSLGKISGGGFIWCAPAGLRLWSWHCASVRSSCFLIYLHFTLTTILDESKLFDPAPLHTKCFKKLSSSSVKVPPTTTHPSVCVSALCGKREVMHGLTEGGGWRGEDGGNHQLFWTLFNIFMNFSSVLVQWEQWSSRPPKLQVG